MGDGAQLLYPVAKGEPAMTQILDVDALLASLTLEQKASLCSGSDFWHTQGLPDAGIPSVMVTDGPHGLRKQVEGSDHLGLGTSVPATCFPTASALASSWDGPLLYRVGVALGEECRQENVAVLLGPGINMKRSPLCGRNFEYFSEDPVLAGDLAAALVNGVQGQGIGTSLKHFAANNQETDRLRVSADVDERTLREIYLPAFERVVMKASPWTVMCSYNKINGIYASEDPWLLTDVLRGEWGYDGMVVSDWGAVNVRPHALAAGMDLEMPSSDGAGDAAIVAAVRAGELDEAIVDRAARRVLELLNKSLPALQAAEAEGYRFDVEAHDALAREVAAQCAVLLRNSGGVLPLKEEGDVAVVGAFAITPRYQGAGSSQVNPTNVSVALEEMRLLAGDVNVSFAEGFSIEHDDVDQALIDAAVANAESAHTIVLFLGLPSRYESEGFDRKDLELPANQLACFDALAATGKPIVVVLSNGGVVSLEPWHDRAAAIVEMWLGGQASGGAAADILFGKVAPSGKLAETIPFCLGDNPSYLNFPGEREHVLYGEGVNIGYRYYDSLDRGVRYPFGHGLSYTSFEYSDLVVQVTDAAAGKVAVAFTVTNTGERFGSEAAQLYVSDPEASVARPPLELKGFSKVHLAPGASERVSISLTSRDFSFWDIELGAWKREGGEFVVAVGASSRDLRLRASIELPDDGARAALRADSTIAEWLAHPVARELLGSAFTENPMMANEDMMTLMGSMPMSRITKFPGVPITEEMLAGLVAAVNA